MGGDRQGLWGDGASQCPPLNNPRPQEAAPGVWGRSEAGDRGVCEAEVSRGVLVGFGVQGGPTSFPVCPEQPRRQPQPGCLYHTAEQSLQPPRPTALRGPWWGWGGAPDTPLSTPKPAGRRHHPSLLQVPGDHPHPPDGPPRIQIPVGATGRKGDLQEGCAERRGKGEAVLGGSL